MINKNLINLKKILLAGSDEGWNVQKLNINTLKKYITTDFTEPWHQYLKDTIIYRGENNITNNISYVIPGERYSENTFNHYTELFSEILPSWKDFPKRNHSVICTTNRRVASQYGDIYIILPKSGVNLGICPKDDIWDSFPLFSKEIKEENARLNVFTDTVDIIMYALYNKEVDMKFLLEDFKNHEKLSINLFKDNSFAKCYKVLYKNRNNLFKFLNNIFDPYKNGFVTSNNNIPNYCVIDREVWFDDDYIAIKENVMNKIVKKIGNLDD